MEQMQATTDDVGSGGNDNLSVGLSEQLSQGLQCSAQDQGDGAGVDTLQEDGNNRLSPEMDCEGGGC